METQNQYKTLVAFNIDLAIAHLELFTFPIFIQKGTVDFIEIFQQQIELKRSFNNYKTYGLKNIYLLPENYDFIIMELNKLNQKQNITFNDLLPIFNEAGFKLRQLGFSEYSISRAILINDQVIKFSLAMPTLAELIKNFKANQENLFFRYVVKSFIAIAMVESFDWQTDVIKNKIGQACLFMDINLSFEDLNYMRTNEMKKWPKELFNHPLDNASNLLKQFDKISPEVIQIIQLHHELPGSEGFPRGINSQNIPILAALVIIAELFCEKILDSDFSPEYKNELLDHFDRRFMTGVFRHAKESLIKAINKG